MDRSDERLADRAYRAKHRAEIVALITGWTKQHDGYDVMHGMNKNVVSCGATLYNKKVMSDPTCGALFQKSRRCRERQFPLVVWGYPPGINPPHLRLGEEARG